MGLKMYVFGESYGVTTWVVANNKEQAISIYEHTSDFKIEDEVDNVDEYVREAKPNEKMTYYHDLVESEHDTMENLIKKYCTKPDMFATSEF